MLKSGARQNRVFLRTEEGYCEETSQKGQSNHSPDHQIRSITKIIGIK